MMTSDVIRMARGRDNLLLQMIKRHFPHIPIDDDDTWRMFLDFANEIYATGAAAERDACAKFLLSTDLSGLRNDLVLQNWTANLLTNYAEAILAKGQL